MLNEDDKRQSMNIEITMSHLESYILEKLMSMPVRRELVSLCEGFFGEGVTEDEICDAWDTISEKVNDAMQEAW